MGAFSIARGLLEDQPQDVLELLKLMDVVVVRAECNLCRQCVDYEGFSKHFEPIKLGDNIPHYEFHFRTEDGKKLLDRVERRERL
jgi:hypothetical protein